MSSVISLKEAARRTGLTTRQIGDKIAEGTLSIERDPVTGEKGIYPYTLRGVNGYQPPEPAPPPRPAPPPPPEPEPWTPSHAEIAALIKLDDRGRAIAIADLVRRHPHLREWLRDNPLPPVYRKPEPPPPPPQAKPEPPPPPPSWQTSWQMNWRQSWDHPPEPVPPKPPEPPRPTPPVVPPPSSEGIASLFAKVLKLSLARLVQAARDRLGLTLSPYARLAGVVVLVGLVSITGLILRALVSAYVGGYHSAPHPAPQVRQPAQRHHAQPIPHYVQHPTVPLPSPHSLPPLRPPGTGRPQLENPR